MYARRVMQQNIIVKQQGFTLIELIAGIVLMAFLSVAFLATIAPHLVNSVRPQMQIRALEFGQSLMAEVMSRKFDEASPLGGVPRCDATICTTDSNLGADTGEGSNRQLFDDVDDYNVFCDSQYTATDAWGNSDGLNDMKFQVCVFYDNNYDALNDNAMGAAISKMIIVRVYPPSVQGGLDAPIVLSAYRSNY